MSGLQSDGFRARSADAAAATTAVEIRDVDKVFETRSGQVQALDTIDLTVGPGEFVSLIGPSGCGKSTLMRLIADLDEPTGGSVTVFGKSARRARLDQEYGIAFQSAGLLPWRTVAANVALPLELHGVASHRPFDPSTLRQAQGTASSGHRKLRAPQAQGGAAARSSRVAELLEMVGLADFADRYPDQLSGGMQQRVAIARSLAEQPRLLLMDEPFGALDEMTREKMQTELVRISAETGAAVVFVTHSIPEAVFLSDRVVVMSPRPGRIQEIVPMRLGADASRAARTEGLREERTFFDMVTAVREALHDGSPVASGPRGVETR
ncbi:ABC transporter ATP-binding protein [Agromyces sp. NPDC058484]|uniref:ABC transporter ATP-binding protein n=1 Tax=Agromyces sp. NPDC058484 TaxID=3346524 RepID=UPI003650C4DC